MTARTMAVEALVRRWIARIGIATVGVLALYFGWVLLLPWALRHVTSGMFTGIGLLLAVVMGWWVLYGEPEHEAKHPRWSSRRLRPRGSRREVVRASH